MAEERSTTRKSDQPSDEDVAATSAQYAGDPEAAVPSVAGTEATNPVDLGTDLDKLPPVPGAGQFMPADAATEPVAPGPGDSATKKG